MNTRKPRTLANPEHSQTPNTCEPPPGPGKNEDKRLTVDITSACHARCFAYRLSAARASDRKGILCRTRLRFCRRMPLHNGVTAAGVRATWLSRSQINNAGTGRQEPSQLTDGQCLGEGADNTETVRPELTRRWTAPCGCAAGYHASAPVTCGYGEDRAVGVLPGQGVWRDAPA
jgi:hypothetical protein